MCRTTTRGVGALTCRSTVRASPLEIKVDCDARSTLVAIMVAVAVVVPVMARVAPAVVTAGTPSVPSIPAAIPPTIRAPLTMTPLADLFDSAGLYLFGFWHENRSGA